jgi:hypothetical protein
MSARARYKGSLDDLHAAIAPFVVSPGWLMYQEKPKDPVKPEILVAQKFLLRSLTSVCKNLSFSKKQLDHVFERLLKEKSFKELNDKESQEDWVETMSKRARMACRHLAQARIRKPPPRWLAHIDVGEVSPDSMSQLSSFAGDGHLDGDEEEEETGEAAEPAGPPQDAQEPECEELALHETFMVTHVGPLVRCSPSAHTVPSDVIGCSARQATLC